MMDVRRMSAAAILVLACSAVAAAQAKGGGADSKTGLAAEQSASLEATAPPLDATATPGASEADPNDKPFARLFPNLWTDLRLLVSTKDNAITWAIGGAGTLALLPFDHEVSDELSDPSSGGVMHAATVLGSGYVQAGAAVATYAVGRLTHHKATAHIGADLVRSQILAGVVTHGLKITVRRDRPQASDDSTATFSFPSAHSSATWTSATVLWRHLGWKVGIPAAAVATLVSASRVEQRQHFMSDVAFGAAIGVASGRTVTMGHVSGRRVTIAPQSVPRGVAVMATLGSQ